MKKSKKSPKIHAHNSVLWLRLCFIMRVETGFANEAISFPKIRKLCGDVPLEELDMTLREMTRSGRLLCLREWTEDGRMIEIFTNNE